MSEEFDVGRVLAFIESESAKVDSLAVQAALREALERGRAREDAQAIEASWGYDIGGEG